MTPSTNPPLITPESLDLVPRNKLVTDLITKLRQDRFVAVNGPIGSGKSTLVKTLLAQKLNEGGIEGRGGRSWRIIYTEPKMNPIANLAMSILKPGDELPAETLGLFAKGTLSLNIIDQVKKILTVKSGSENEGMDSAALTLIYEEAKRSQPEPFNLLIIIDQAHDLFRYKSSAQGGMGNELHPNEDVLYFNLLLSAKRSKDPIYVILVTDSRYLANFYKYRGLPEAINNATYYVPGLIEGQDLQDFLAKRINPSNPKIIPSKYEKLLPKLIQDYKVLSKENPAIILNLNVFMQLLFKQNRQDPLEYYQSLNAEGYNKAELPLSKAIAHHLEKEVYNDLSPEEKEWIKRSFQALTALDGGEEYRRRPVSLGNLKLWLKRAPSKNIDPSLSQAASELSDKMIVDLLRRFNTPIAEFILLPSEDDALDDKLLIDIKYDALLSAWPQLSNWIHEEWDHSQIYQNLVRDAIHYYTSQNKVEQKGTADQPSESAKHTQVYDGAAFLSAQNWMEMCRPNDDWALRYLPASSDRTAQLEPEKLNVKTFDNEKNLNFFVAQKFYEKCVANRDETLDQKNAEIKRTKRQRTQALILSSLATIALVFALVQWNRVEKEKHKIGLAHFVNTLSDNWVLNLSNNLYDTTDLMAKLNTQIYSKHTFKSENELLDYLWERRFISIGTEDEDVKKLSYQALKTLKEADQELALEALSTHQQALLKHAKAGEFNQYPAFYYAWYKRYWDSPDIHQVDHSRSTIIESGALDTNNHALRYGFGDKDGQIYLISSEGRLIDSPNVGGVIKSLCFGSDKSTLYTGTELGEISAYQFKYLNNGQLQRRQLNWNTPIYKDSLRKSIYFLGSWPRNPQLLLVGSTWQAYFLQQKKASPPVPFGTIRLEPKRRVACRIWAPEHRLFLVGGRDSVVIYHLDPSNLQTPIKMLTTITGGGSTSQTITSMAIRYKKTQLQERTEIDYFNLAMGDEDGNVWIGELKLPHSRLDSPVSLSFDHFERFKGAESSITCLAFNPSLPQLASGSLDGCLRLWNLNTLDKNNKNKQDNYYDDVTLQYGNILNALIFLNANELVVHCGLDHWIEPSNFTFIAERILSRKKELSQK